MGGSRARWVALGILCSRISGLARSKAFAWFFGTGPHKDALDIALRLPNLVQNLLGDQAMSAAFIPVMSRLLGEGRREEARRFAGAILGLVALTVFGAVLIGIAAAPLIVTVFSPGLVHDAARVAEGTATVDRFPLTVAAIRIVFPMVGLLVIAAWAQGILNSHRRFFLPYVAPVAWNGAIIATLLVVTNRSGGIEAVTTSDLAARLATLDRWLTSVCAGAVVGAALQLAVQLPLVLKLLGGVRPTLDRADANVGTALRAFGPALAGRGVVQLSLYLDQILASFLAPSGISLISYAALLYSLPVSAFAMSVAASELPELSRRSADQLERVQARVTRGLRQTAFLVVPTVVGYWAFGFVIVGFLRGGAFGVDDQWLVYLVLCGYTLGLPASTISRLLQNTFFAFGDTRTPARIAAVRVLTAVSVGVTLMIPFDRVSLNELVGISSGEPLFLGALGLSIGAGVSGWVELLLLRRALVPRLPGLRLPVAYVGGQVVLAMLVAIPAAALWWSLRAAPVWCTTIAVPSTYAVAYLAVAWYKRSPELDLWLGRGGD